VKLRFHHIGMAVESLRAAVEWLQETGDASPRSDPVHDPIQGVNLCFLELGGQRIELLEPEGSGSRVDRYVESGGAYHICFEVENLDVALRTWRERGAFPVTKPEPAVAFGGRRVVFLLTPQRLLVELLEIDPGAG
jgi:methylmalonyl-CoA/ethylmalonyl-CoA epimerase